ncbi:MAG: tetratricopeptide repeat protein [Candidatus Dadabacteria bacterium]|nr:tetratricopeptide repeat protein [Candidatus Dadabacteria bacterium]
MNSADEWLKKGVELAKQGKYEEALEAFERAIESEPSNAEAWYRKGIVLGVAGRYEEALVAHVRTLDLDPENVEVWYLKGLVLVTLKRYEESLDALEKALEINPEYSEAWYLKGLALVSLERYEESLDAFDKALEINPENDVAWYNKGIALYRLERYEEAVEAYDKALNINPDLVEALRNKGVVLYELGSYKEALNTYNKSMELDPENALSHKNVGELYLNIGNQNSATDEVERALGIDENYAYAWHLKGKIQIEKHDYDGAIESFNKAISNGAGNPSFLLWLAYAEYLKTEFSLDSEDVKYKESMVSVIRNLERAEKLSESSGEQGLRAYIFYFLGSLYYKNQDIFSAKEKLQKCIKVDSEIKHSAVLLLDYIWNHQIKPPFWEWWLGSPINQVRKIVMFLFLLLAIVGLSFGHPFIPEVYFGKIHWGFYMSFVLFLIVLLFYPSIEQIKTKDFEFKVHSPPSFDPVLSPARLEEMMTRQLEEGMTRQVAHKAR